MSGLDPDLVVEAGDPADVRASVAEAIERGRITFPPYETDTWPRARPLLKWFLRLLPEGAEREAQREWTDQELDEAARDAGRPLTDPG